MTSLSTNERRPLPRFTTSLLLCLVCFFLCVSRCCYHNGELSLASGTIMTSLSTNERRPLPRFTTNQFVAAWYVSLCVCKDVVVVAVVEIGGFVVLFRPIVDGMGLTLGRHDRRR